MVNMVKNGQFGQNRTKIGKKRSKKIKNGQQQQQNGQNGHGVRKVYHITLPTAL